MRLQKKQYKRTDEKKVKMGGWREWARERKLTILANWLSICVEPDVEY